MNVEIDPKLCFVLMPMRDEFIQLYEDVIKPTVSEVGLSCFYADEIFGPRPIMADVWEYCEKARVVIAELTGCNPNVFYEAGYAHAFDREKVVFITQDMEEVTFDIRHFRCIEYGLLPRGIEELKRRLKRNIEAVLAEEPQPPRVVTMKVEVSGPPEPPDEATKEALVLRDAVLALERGQKPPSTEEVARLLKLLVNKVGVPEPAEAVSLEFLRRQTTDFLRETEREVLVLRFGLKDGRRWTLEEVGEMFGVTRERVRQIEAKALRKVVRALLGH